MNNRETRRQFLQSKKFTIDGMKEVQDRVQSRRNNACLKIQYVYRKHRKRKGRVVDNKFIKMITSSGDTTTIDCVPVASYKITGGFIELLWSMILHWRIKRILKSKKILTCSKIWRDTYGIIFENMQELQQYNETMSLASDSSNSIGFDMEYFLNPSSIPRDQRNKVKAYVVSWLVKERLIRKDDVECFVRFLLTQISAPSSANSNVNVGSSSSGHAVRSSKLGNGAFVSPSAASVYNTAKELFQFELSLALQYVQYKHAFHDVLFGTVVWREDDATGNEYGRLLGYWDFQDVLYACVLADVPPAPMPIVSANGSDISLVAPPLISMTSSPTLKGKHSPSTTKINAKFATTSRAASSVPAELLAKPTIASSVTGVPVKDKQKLNLLRQHIQSKLSATSAVSASTMSGVTGGVDNISYMDRSGDDDRVKTENPGISNAAVTIKKSLENVKMRNDSVAKTNGDANTPSPGLAAAKAALLKLNMTYSGSASGPYDTTNTATSLTSSPRALRSSPNSMKQRSKSVQRSLRPSPAGLDSLTPSSTITTGQRTVITPGTPRSDWGMSVSSKASSVANSATSTAVNAGSVKSNSSLSPSPNSRSRFRSNSSCGFGSGDKISQSRKSLSQSLTASTGAGSRVGVSRSLLDDFGTCTSPAEPPDPAVKEGAPSSRSRSSKDALKQLKSKIADKATTGTGGVNGSFKTGSGLETGRNGERGDVASCPSRKVTKVPGSNSKPQDLLDEGMKGRWKSCSDAPSNRTDSGTYKRRSKSSKPRQQRIDNLVHSLDILSSEINQNMHNRDWVSSLSDAPLLGHNSGPDNSNFNTAISTLQTSMLGESPISVKNTDTTGAAGGASVSMPVSINTPASTGSVAAKSTHASSGSKPKSTAAVVEVDPGVVVSMRVKSVSVDNTNSQNKFSVADNVSPSSSQSTKTASIRENNAPPLKKSPPFVLRAKNKQTSHSNSPTSGHSGDKLQHTESNAKEMTGEQRAEASERLVLNRRTSLSKSLTSTTSPHVSSSSAPPAVVSKSQDTIMISVDHYNALLAKASAMAQLNSVAGSSSSDAHVVMNGISPSNTKTSASSGVVIDLFSSKKPTNPNPTSNNKNVNSNGKTSKYKMNIGTPLNFNRNTDNSGDPADDVAAAIADSNSTTNLNPTASHCMPADSIIASATKNNRKQGVLPEDEPLVEQETKAMMDSKSDIGSVSDTPSANGIIRSGVDHSITKVKSLSSPQLDESGCYTDAQLKHYISNLISKDFDYSYTESTPSLSPNPSSSSSPKPDPHGKPMDSGTPSRRASGSPMRVETQHRVQDALMKIKQQQSSVSAKQMTSK